MYAVNDTLKSFLVRGIRFNPYTPTAVPQGFAARPEFIRLKKYGTVKVFANLAQAAGFAGEARRASVYGLPGVKARVNGTLDEYLDKVNRLDAPDWKKVVRWYIALGCKCLLGDVADTVELRVAKVMRGKETVTTDVSQSVADTKPEASVSPVDSSETTPVVSEAAAAAEPEKAGEETPAAAEEEKTNPVHGAVPEQITDNTEEHEAEGTPVDGTPVEASDAEETPAEPDVEESEQTAGTTEEAPAESEPQTEDEQQAKKSRKRNKKG